MSEFFIFDQNNSGGFYKSDDIVAATVIIEARDYIHANEIADKLGIFNYHYCKCCGRRFELLYGTEPTVPDVDAAIAIAKKLNKFQDYIIHFLDGKIDKHQFS